MKQVTTIGLDLAKAVFQVHGVDQAGVVTLRRAVRRSQLLSFFAKLPPCLVGMEACATAHYWARAIAKLGHEVRLIPRAYAKAYVRRNKNDPADAAAICEAVSRPSMRFVTIKTEVQQAAAGIHKVREMLVKQRTMLINTLRGLMAEFGIVVAEGPRHVGELVAILADPADRRIPNPLHEGLLAIVETLGGLQRRIEIVEKRIVGWGRDSQTCRHLITIPGYGPIPRFRGGRLCPARWPRWSSTLRALRAGGTSLHRSVWCRGRTGPVARSSLVRSANAVTAICAGSWSMAQCRCCPASAPRRIPGWRNCLPASRVRSPPARSPTKWRGSAGR